MNTLLKLIRLATQSPTKAGVSYTTIRSAAHCSRDYMPGKKPTTPEEHNAAAEKYGLHPYEYKPYDDTKGFGGFEDYPNLPYIGTAAKDPYYPYDYPVLRRNYNEPIHVHLDMIGEDRYSAGQPDAISGYEAFGKFFAVMGSFFFVYWLTIHYDIKLVNARAEKQYPKPGVVHYEI